MERSRIKQFLLFIILFFSFSVVFIPATNASEVQDPVIDVDILSVSLGSFQDQTTGDGSGKLKTAAGGYDLISFNNLGIYAVNQETNTILYWAEATFRFEVNAWTECLYNNIFPFININHETKYAFFTLSYKSHNLIGQPYTSSTQHYYSKFREIDYGTTKTVYYPYGGFNPTEINVPNSYLMHNYDGYLPITVSVDPGMKFSGKITLQGETFEVPVLTSDIINTKLVSTRSGEVGSYQDRYTDITGISKGTVKITVLDDVFTKIVTGSDKISAWLNNQNLGWRLYRDVTIDPFASIQQSIRSEGCIGTVYPDDNPSTYDVMTFNLPVHIQPEVTKQAQILEFIVAKVQYWKDSGTLKPTYGPVTETYQRDVSVHVKNQFVYHEFEAKTNLFMTCQFTGKLSESFLSDPNLVISDMIWSNDLLGAHKVDIGLKKEPTWWDWILYLIIIIVVLYIVYRIVKVYINRRAGLARSAKQLVG